MSGWTAEQIAELQELMDDGLTFVEIGRRMGLTKNQCIGKASRMGMARRDEAPMNPAQLAVMMREPQPRALHDRMDAEHARMDAILAETAAALAADRAKRVVDPQKVAA